MHASIPQGHPQTQSALRGFGVEVCARVQYDNIVIYSKRASMDLESSVHD